jgi:predicted permease
MLSVVGTACGVLIAWWGIGVLRTSMPDGVPRVTAIALDFRVLAAAAGLSLLTGLVVGLLPALQLSRPDLVNALKSGSRSSAGTLRHRTRSALVVAEVALAVVLLVGAALFIGSFISLVRIDPGFDPTSVLTAQVSPRIRNPMEPPDHSPVFAELLQRLARIPGVTHAAMVAPGVPMAGGGSVTTTLRIPGRSNALNAEGRIGIRRVTPGFFHALRIPVRSGRAFSDDDRTTAPAVVIINEAAARQYFPGEDPVGRVVSVYKDRTIVGVVGDIHQVNVETEPVAEAYVPFAQDRLSGGELAIRTSGEPYEILPAVRAAVYGVLPDVPLRNVRTMEELVERRIAQRKLSMLLLSLFGLLGLTIAVVGVYGVLAFMVWQRTREIGVRIALGATPSNVMAGVLLNAAALVTAGLVLGGVAAWYLSAAARAFLFELEPTEPRAFAAAAVCVVIAAIAASAIPARRAARVDPMVALRAD